MNKKKLIFKIRIKKKHFEMSKAKCYIVIDPEVEPVMIKSLSKDDSKQLKELQTICGGYISIKTGKKKGFFEIEYCIDGNEIRTEFIDKCVKYGHSTLYLCEDVPNWQYQENPTNIRYIPDFRCGVDFPILQRCVIQISEKAMVSKLTKDHQRGYSMTGILPYMKVYNNFDEWQKSI